MYEPQPTPKMIRSGDLNQENDYKVVKVCCGHNHGVLLRGREDLHVGKRRVRQVRSHA